MSRNLSRPEIEDFWYDCIKNELPKKNKDKSKIPKKLKVHFIGNSNLLNNRENINSDRRKTNKIPKKYKLINENLKTEESIKKSKKKNKDKQIEILTSLYIKDIEDKRRVQDELNKLREKKKDIELENCSFKPKLINKRKNNYEEAYKKNYGGKRINEREKIYKNNNENKMKILKKEALCEENEKFVFRPQIEPKNVNKVLYGNNLWEKRANNFTNRLFLWRYMKARIQESDKKKRLIWSLDKSKNKELNREKRMINNNKCVNKSISQKDSLFYKQSLHSSLLDFQNSMENDNNNSNIEIIN